MYVYCLNLYFFHSYLEEVLASNPSDHPTVIFSHIKFSELKLVVDFMYAGEVAVEQARLSKLLEAARAMKIKGLWENGQGIITNQMVSKLNFIYFIIL